MNPASSSNTANAASPGLRAGARLPAANLMSAPDGVPVRLRSGRGPRVIMVVHSSACTACQTYVHELVAQTPAIAEWGGRVTVVVGEPLSLAVKLHNTWAGAVQVLADPDRTLGIREGSLVIADEWGEVYFTADAGPDHALPAPAEVAEWVRFIAIQCPECEQPEGAWKTL